MCHTRSLCVTVTTVRLFHSRFSPHLLSALSVTFFLSCEGLNISDIGKFFSLDWCPTVSKFDFNHIYSMACWNNNAVQEIEALIEKTVDASSDFYNMSHKNRGTAVIFNHKYFAVQNLDTRSGTKVDRDKLKKALKCLGFDVKVYNDLTYKAIIKVLKEVAEDDHSESDAFIMAVLTHGKPDGLYANDGPYPSDILWKSFTDEKCPTLSKKPKIFFIQACQGYKFDAGVTLQRTKVDNDILSPRIRVNTSVEYKFFSDPDFLIAFSTAPGYYSWRNTTSGSWFIRALCTELKKQGGKLHLLSLLTVVSRRVAIDYESYCPENPTFHNKKQIPCVFSMLTKLLIFPKKTNDVCRSM